MPGTPHSAHTDAGPVEATWRKGHYGQAGALELLGGSMAFFRQAALMSHISPDKEETQGLCPGGTSPSSVVVNLLSSPVLRLTTPQRDGSNLRM